MPLRASSSGSRSGAVPYERRCRPILSHKAVIPTGISVPEILVFSHRCHSFFTSDLSNRYIHTMQLDTANSHIFEKPHLCGLPLIQITPCKRHAPAFPTPAGTVLRSAPYARRSESVPAPSRRQVKSPVSVLSVTLYLCVKYKNKIRKKILRKERFWPPLSLKTLLSFIFKHN